jgi:outer membrane protein
MKSVGGRVRNIGLAAAILGLLLSGASYAAAETLSDALSAAYSSNPTLRADRARQRGTDEVVPQALSGWRPVVTTQGSVGRTWSRSERDGRSNSTPGSVNIDLSQPVFKGFRTVNGTKAAESDVLAGRQNLLAVEQDILFQCIQAYMNVIRDRKVLALRKQNVSVLRQQLTAANDRFAVGEITRTDVAQSRARVAQAQANVASANASLAASIANYDKIVGHKPGSLKYPPLAKLPRSLDRAQDIASEVNPNILAAAFVEESSVYNIEVVKADLLPEVDVIASAQLEDDFDRDNSNANSRSASLQGVLTIPLYEAGRVYSGVRQAKQVASQRRLQVIETGRSVREAVSNSWNNLLAARQLITANRSQVSASELALDGVRQEYLVGSRATLDVLDAQAEVVNARISLVAAERDQVVASYQVLGSMGQLTARDLDLPVEYYDVEENYRNVRNKWIGTGANTVE